MAAVGPAGSVPNPPDAESLALGSAILLPGLVNTHTHLELTGFAPTASELDFRRWILSIRRLKQAQGPGEFLAAARRGIQDCWAGGVTTVADTGDSGAVAQALAELGGSGIVYQEVFGPHPEQLTESVAGLESQVAGLAGFAGERVRVGVSPHAPYTVSGPLYSRVSEWAREHGLPLAVHIAESVAEREFVTQGTGPFAEAWAARGIPPLSDPSQLPHRRTAALPHTPIQWLDAHGVLGPRTLCIHAIQLTSDDVQLLAQRGAAVAHCPVSNAAHGHGAAPLAALRAAGIRVGIGTDSVASVGRLDLWQDARAAQSLARLSDAEALTLATLEGARALGLDSELGSVTTGKWGDLVAVRGPAEQASVDPVRAALQSSPADVLLTVLGGRIVHQSPPA